MYTRPCGTSAAAPTAATVDFAVFACAASAAARRWALHTLLMFCFRVLLLPCLLALPDTTAIVAFCLLPCRGVDERRRAYPRWPPSFSHTFFITR
jgi:hypothetical protein